MKKLILSLTAALSLNVFATSPVQPPENSLAQMRMGGGMPVPGGLRSREITVYKDGEVKVKESRYPKDFNHGGPVEEAEFSKGFAKPEDLRALQAAADSIERGGLTTPKGPECADAPGYSYGIVKDGYVIAIYTRYNCREAFLKDKSKRLAAAAIVDYLQQWN